MKSKTNIKIGQRYLRVSWKYPFIVEITSISDARIKRPASEALSRVIWTSSPPHLKKNEELFCANLDQKNLWKLLLGQEAFEEIK